MQVSLACDRLIVRRIKEVQRGFDHGRVAGRWT
jgi:hypothetical protein